MAHKNRSVMRQRAYKANTIQFLGLLTVYILNRIQLNHPMPRGVFDEPFDVGSHVNNMTLSSAATFVVFAGSAGFYDLKKHNEDRLESSTPLTAMELHIAVLCVAIAVNVVAESPAVFPGYVPDPLDFIYGVLANVGTAEGVRRYYNKSNKTGFNLEQLPGFMPRSPSIKPSWSAPSVSR